MIRIYHPPAPPHIAIYFVMNSTLPHPSPGIYILVQKLYSSPRPFRKWYFCPSRDSSFFDSYCTLFALILPYFAFILPFYFPFSLFLSPFFLFYFSSFLSSPLIFFPPNDIADISSPGEVGGDFPIYRTMPLTPHTHLSPHKTWTEPTATQLWFVLITPSQ